MSELVPVLITAAMAGFSSVGLWKIVELMLKRRWQRGDSFEDKHAECVREVEALKARVAILEHHKGSYLARWIKNGDRRIEYVNDKAFLSIFAPLGMTRDGVIGRTFAELLLDPRAADEIDRLDAAALAHPDVAASNVIQLHPLLPVMVVVKVAAVGREGELVFEGYAYRTNDSMIADGFGAARQHDQIGASAERVLGDGAD